MRAEKHSETTQRDDYIPLYVLTGFLGSGKTTFLNTLFSRRLMRGKQICFIQFEQGDTEVNEQPQGHGHLEILRFSKREMDNNIHGVKAAIYRYLTCHTADELWVEWNGVLPFTDFQFLFLADRRCFSGQPGDFCVLKKVMHMADCRTLEQQWGRTGAAVIEQAAASDLVVFHNAASDREAQRLTKLIHSVNPGVKTFQNKSTQMISREIYSKKRSPINWLCGGTLLLTAFYLLLRQIPAYHSSSADTVINILLGILLQAFPFLLIGVLLSSVIQVFVSRQFIERWFPKNLPGSMLFAVLGGFLLPVCDCASIPIFRSLVKKGIPLSSAVVFMTATPVINPVVILSTYYAFSGNLKIVLARIGLGIVCAVLTGLSFVFYKQKSMLLYGGMDNLLCGCGCFESVDSARGFTAKAGTLMRHAQSEFFGVGKYLLMGAFVSAVFQTVGGKISWAQSGTEGLLLPLMIMMCMAFFLSLCSSSDAIVARSFAGAFPMGALMGFLVFGPMMDVKNIILLSGGFPRGFIVRLAVTTFIVCFLIVFLFFKTGLEGLLT